MADSTLVSTKLTDGQVDCVLNDIAITANVMKRFCIMLVHAEDERDIDALTLGIERLADRVGLLADVTAGKRESGSGPVFGELPETWMMPPSYHDQNGGSATAQA